MGDVLYGFLNGSTEAFEVDQLELLDASSFQTYV